MKNDKWYAKNWKQQSLACRTRNNWTCQHCGTYYGKNGIERVSERTGVVYIERIQACHKYHDTLNENAELLCLCPTCHRKYDNSVEQRKLRLRYARMRAKMLLEKYGYEVPNNSKRSRKAA